MKLREEFKEAIEQSTLKKQINEKLDDIIESVKLDLKGNALDDEYFIVIKSREFIKNMDLIDVKNKIYLVGGCIGELDDYIGLYIANLIIPKLYPDLK